MKSARGRCGFRRADESDDDTSQKRCVIERYVEAAYTAFGSLPSCLGTRFARRLHAESTHRQLFPTFALALYPSRFTTKGRLGSAVIGSKIWCGRLVYQYEEQERMAAVRTKCTQSRNRSATSKPSVFFKQNAKSPGAGSWEMTSLFMKAASSRSTLLIRYIRSFSYQDPNNS